MKNRSAKILASLMLLLTFVVGQVIVFAHSHQVDTRQTKHYAQNAKAKVVEDNCLICAQHGNLQLFLQQQPHFYFWSLTSVYQSVNPAAIYQSVKLLLSGNRGPPALNFLLS